MKAINFQKTIFHYSIKQENINQRHLSFYVIKTILLSCPVTANIYS